MIVTFSSRSDSHGEGRYAGRGYAPVRSKAGSQQGIPFIAGWMRSLDAWRKVETSVTTVQDDIKEMRPVSERGPALRSRDRYYDYIVLCEISNSN